MSTAEHTLLEARMGRGCLGKAAPDEPVFVLRAKDAVSTGLIERWVNVVEATHGANEKTRQARQVIVEFERWQHANRDIVKIPD